MLQHHNPVRGVLAALVLATGAHGEIRAQATASPADDVVIRGGRVLDGAGNPWIVTIDHGKHTGAKAGQVLYGLGHPAPSTMLWTAQLLS